ncbi:hypothetical protein MalM25_20130 [Planctomycetes bacterium MalM25]|nr:hypothetical protein MalM25_20130 [Planctomycetes bacterium MalM25]
MNKASLVAPLLVALLSSPSQGVELLTDGGFEYSGLLPGWELEESIYDQTTMMRRDIGGVNSAQQQGFGPESGDFALWLRAFVGGATTGPDNLTNAALFQSVEVTEGETYTFSGWSRFETFYSGGADTLDPGGPLGGVASPTTNTLELAFYDGSGALIGSPTSIDVKTDRSAQSGLPFLDDWVQHELMAVAPVGAATARVLADAEQMLWNGGGNESAFYDSFSLTGAGDPSTELLLNPGLEEEPSEFHPAYVVTEDPGGNFGTPGATVEAAGFANRPDSGGSLGLWLRSFEGSEADPAGATIAQTVEGTPGGEYTFSAWSRFETNYVGGLEGFGTTTQIELAFLDGSDVEIGTPLTLDLKTDRESQSGGGANDGMWYEHELTAVAPAGTASVRVLGEALGMLTNPDGGGQSAFFDDFSLELLTDPGLAGDYNDDGTVDAADYTVWRDGGSPDSSQTGYDTWANNYGATASPAVSVPEPSSALLVGAGLLLLARSRR